MSASLRCEICGKAIETKKDLVVTNRLYLRFFTLHSDCLRQALNEGKYYGRPANTKTADIALAIILAIALGAYIFTRQPLLLLVLIGSPAYRLLVWWRFQRRLPGN